MVYSRDMSERILPRLNAPTEAGGIVTIKQIIGEAIGAASVCWESLEGTGVFDSTRASQLIDEVLEEVERWAGPIYHDEQTLKKIYDSLMETGCTDRQAIDAVSIMQNRGIFFRERQPNG